MVWPLLPERLPSFQFQKPRVLLTSRASGNSVALGCFAFRASAVVPVQGFLRDGYVCQNPTQRFLELIYLGWMKS